MRVLGLAAVIGLSLTGCIQATAQPWYDEPRGYREYHVYDRSDWRERRWEERRREAWRERAWRERQQERAWRERAWRERERERAARAYRPAPGRGIPAGACYTAPPRPHAAPQVICRY
jgi:hypothetical protein